jgi:hypothetical protein
MNGLPVCLLFFDFKLFPEENHVLTETIQQTSADIDTGGFCAVYFQKQIRG